MESRKNWADKIKETKNYGFALLFIMVTGLCAYAGYNGDQPVNLFIQRSDVMTSQPQLRLNDSDMPPGLFERARRHQAVEINPFVKIPSNIRKGDQLSLQLFEDDRIATVDRVDVDINDVYSIRARFEEEHFGYALLSIDGQNVVAAVRSELDDYEYYILPREREQGIQKLNDNGPKHQLMEIHYSDLDIQECAVCAAECVHEFHPDDEFTYRTDGHTQAVDDEISGQWHSEDYVLYDAVPAGGYSAPTINVMVVYTPAAQDWASGQGGINNFINQTMQSGQTTIDDSDINLNLRLTHSAIVNYTESGTISTDLSRLRGTDNGYMDEVHDWRDEYRADMVALLASNPGGGGIAYLLGDTSGSPASAFSVTRIQQAVSSLTFIHELGHNFGCHHSRNQNDAAAPSSGGLFEYSTGWRWPGSSGQGWVSVMTYLDGDQRHGAFSNPDLLHDGVPTGSYDTSDPVYGQYAPADNARSIREIKDVIANYRPPVFIPYRIEHHWPLNEGDGSYIYDALDGGVDGTLVNMNPNNWIEGVKGNALSFNGANQYVQLDEGFEEMLNGFSVTLWAYPTETKDWARFFDFGNGAGNNNIYFGRRGTTETVIFSVHQDGNWSYIEAEDALDNGQWQFFAATVDDSGQGRIYKDGELIAQGTMEAPVSVKRTQSYIGRSNWSADGYYAGYQDDIRIFNYALAENEVEGIFDSKRQLLHHWKLDDEADWDWDDDASWTAIVDLANTDTESYIITGDRQSNRDDVLFGQPSATSQTDASIKFAGPRERAELGPVSPGINDFTLMFWFKMDQFRGGSRMDHQNHILSSDTDQAELGGWSIHLWGDEDFLSGNEDKPRLDFFQAGHGNIELIEAVEENQWYHVMLTRDGHNNFNIYIDDDIAHSGVNPFSFDDTDAGVWLSKRPTDNSAFDGWIDDVRIYNYAVDDIPDLTGNERVGIEDLAVFIQYWLMDDCGACGGADISLDRKVEFTDFTLFAEQWLAEKD